MVKRYNGSGMLGGEMNNHSSTELTERSIGDSSGDLSRIESALLQVLGLEINKLFFIEITHSLKPVEALAGMLGISHQFSASSPLGFECLTVHSNGVVGNYYRVDSSSTTPNVFCAVQVPDFNQVLLFLMNQYFNRRGLEDWCMDQLDTKTLSFVHKEVLRQFRTSSSLSQFKP